MTILTPTAADAATARPSPVVYVPPPQQVTDELQELAVQGDGVNAPFVADLLSAFVTHERCGRHLYRSVEGRTHNPVLERKYAEFGRETEHHVEVYERLITATGGSPAYVSPMARAVEAMDTKLVESTFLLGGSMDAMLTESVMLDAVFLAESVCHANWQVMGKLAEALPSGELQDTFRAAVAEVERQEDEHLGWAHDTRAKMVLLQAESRMAAKAGEKAEELIARVKNWFS